MPPFLSRLLGRSHPPNPAAPLPRNDTDVPYPRSPTAFPASFPHPPLLRAKNMVAGIFRRSASGGSAHPQNFIDQPSLDEDCRNFINQLFLDGDPRNFSGEPKWAPLPMPPMDIGLFAPRHIHPTTSSDPTDFVEAEKHLAPKPATYTLTVPQKQPSSSEPPDYLPRLQQQNVSMFNQAHNFTATGTFIDGNVTYNVASDEFMEKLLKATIPGAAYDSSARDPPPRCHPGTRLAILERCLHFIVNRDGAAKKMRWVVGGAGVGKSAIMQSVAESPELQVNYHASVFFSINGRNDGTKAIMTVSYQFAAKSEPYRQFIEQETASDPSLLLSSMVKQFEKLIVDPFIYNPQLNSAGPILIIIDGLDECDNPRTQQELLRLISDLCATYPSSPLVWLIASRPEPHITSFFSRPEVMAVHEKEEIRVDSDEARSDVERFLRFKLNEIKKGSDSLDPRWPEEQDIWKLASAAGGLFAYAQTVIRYIGDWRIGSPVSQLSDVLRVIDEHPLTDLSGEEHPMARLDALYAQILSKVPSKIMINTRKLLLALASDWDLSLDYDDVRHGNFIVLCNWLGMTPDEAYAALNHLRSVLYVPRRDEACRDNLRPFHKSFIDFVSDFTRSRFSTDVRGEAQLLKAQCAFRILEEASGGVGCSRDDDSRFRYGTLWSGSGSGGELSLTWSAEEASGWSDITTRWRVYQLAIGEVIAQIRRGDLIFQSEFCVRLLTARFILRNQRFPYNDLCDWVFDEPRRSDFLMCGILKQVPRKAVDLSTISRSLPVKLRYRGPTATEANSCDAWRSSCKHSRHSNWAEGKVQGWTTVFIPRDCDFCYPRLQEQLKNQKTSSPGHTALILLTSTSEHCVEVRYVHDVSEWTYQFWWTADRPNV